MTVKRDDDPKRRLAQADDATNGAHPEYLSYLLRVWRSEPGRAGGWRASLENPHTGERVGFASLEQLFAFVMEQTEQEGGPN